MIKVYPIRPEKRPQVPAVTHVDGTGRLQTVSRRANPRYWQLIAPSSERTGVPMVLNTSFNENEPIVNTPAEALDCFLRTRMDRLVLGDRDHPRRVMLRSLLKPHYLFRPSQAARRLIQALRGTTPASATVRSPWGLQLRIDPRESIGSAVWRLGLYDLAVSETLWRLTSPGDLTVDVGANLGHMTGILALRAGPPAASSPSSRTPTSSTISSPTSPWPPRTREPRPSKPCARPSKRRRRNRQLATGDHFAANRSIARLVEDEEEGIPVQITTLDHALEGRTAAVVKIDVEGSTHRVLEGARDSLRAGRIRDLVYEAHEDERDVLTGILRGRGYTVYALGQAPLGLVLGGGEEAPRLPGYEAPSYVATRDPSRVLAALGGRGWRVLS